MKHFMSRYVDSVGASVGQRGNLVYVAREFKWYGMFDVCFRYIYDSSWLFSCAERCGIIVRDRPITVFVNFFQSFLDLSVAKFSDKLTIPGTTIFGMHDFAF